MLVFDGEIIKALILYTKVEAFISLLITKNKSFDAGFIRLDKIVGQISLHISL